MKKLLLAAVAIISVGAASSSFAGGCGTSYVAQNYCAPTYVVHQPVYKQVLTYPVYQPVHIEKKVIIEQPCHTTYVKPCVQTYNVHTPVHYNTHTYNTGYHYNYKSACGGY